MWNRRGAADGRKGHFIATTGLEPPSYLREEEERLGRSRRGPSRTVLAIVAVVVQ